MKVSTPKFGFLPDVKTDNFKGEIWHFKRRDEEVRVLHLTTEILQKEVDRMISLLNEMGCKVVKHQPGLDLSGSELYALFTESVDVVILGCDKVHHDAAYSIMRHVARCGLIPARQMLWYQIGYDYSRPPEEWVRDNAIPSLFSDDKFGLKAASLIYLSSTTVLQPDRVFLTSLVVTILQQIESQIHQIVPETRGMQRIPAKFESLLTQVKQEGHSGIEVCMLEKSLDVLKKFRNLNAHPFDGDIKMKSMEFFKSVNSLCLILKMTGRPQYLFLNTPYHIQGETYRGFRFACLIGYCVLEWLDEYQNGQQM